MPQFEMNGKETKAFKDLDAFTQAYIEALFFTETNERYTFENWRTPEAQDDIREGRTSGEIPKNAGFNDLAPKALEEIIQDCAAFQRRGEWRSALATCNTDPDLSAQGGHDFWLTRNGHGAGFWDGDWEEPHSDALSDVARGFGEVYTYLGDDNRIYLG